jgi:hypothetical protein
MATTIPPKPRRRGTWIVVLVGLLEIAALVAFFAVKGVATTVCSVAAAAAPQDASASGGASGGAVGGAMAPPPATADQGGGAAGSPMPSAAASQAAAAAAAAPDSSAQAGAGGNPADVKVSGDTNQIVDPNCVAKTAAGLLSENTPAPGPTCGPMKQPEALKAAEKQIQN